MAARNPRAAISSFVQLLSDTTGCVTQVPLNAQRRLDSPTIYRVIFTRAQSALLATQRGRPDALFSFVHECEVVEVAAQPEPFVVKSTYYAFEILDKDQREILTYHWHPHLHLSSMLPPLSIASRGQQPYSISLPELRIPTGRITVEDVVRLLIEEFNVIPLRNDWDDTLARDVDP